ncbi:hypothetical protein BDN70DRAFT_878170 [Pholiota conissans]|uniref:Rhodopsin domain-containing protein n=1 Tax=Pholiota conissans TaxID=109636 RepID=A0A9P5Z4Q1_9AGAR|nr:hypothetical protein BDN70DRAFT_878170 [Pholiota conissans]
MFVLSFGGNLALDVIITLLHIVAIGLTLLRLHYRRSTSRLGWDDYTAALAVLVDVAYFGLLWPTFSAVSESIHLNISKYIKYWLNLELFFAIVCLVRASIALAISRVFPAKEPTRRFSIGLAVFFGLMFITLQSTAICSSKIIFLAPTSGSFKCKWTVSLKFAFIIINIVADLLLVAIPLYKLWCVRLPSRQRMLILAGFSASLLTTLGAIVCSVFQFAPDNWEPARSDLRSKISYLEAGVCLAACNFLVIITFLDNVRRRNLESDDNSLHRTQSPDTIQVRSRSPAPHSNEVPKSDELSTLVLTLTEITDAFVSVDPERSQEPRSVLTSSCSSGVLNSEVDELKS